LCEEYDGDFYDENYFENGRDTGKSYYQNHRWMPRRSFREAFAFIDNLNLDENSKVLDFGGAKGFIVKALRILEIDSDVCDISEYALSFAPEGSWNSSIDKNWELHENAYTHIISKDVFEHLTPKQLNLTLIKLKKLAPIMMCVVPLGDNGIYRISEYHLDISHIIAENEEWWKSAFNNAGWTIVKEFKHLKGLKDSWYHKNHNGNRVYILKISNMNIYKTTNLINGKIYIGQFSGKRNDEKYFGSGILIKNALKKYGQNNFIKEIIEDNIKTTDLLDEREKYWINFYDSTNLEIGYNIAKGGSIGNYKYIRDEKWKSKMSIAMTGRFDGEKNPFFGKHHTEETKEKIRQNRRNYTGENHPRYGSHLTDETKNKISESKSGEKHQNYGKKLSEETKKKISNSKIGSKNPSAKLNEVKVKEIRKLISDGLSDREIAKIYDVSLSTIYEIKKGKTWKNVI
jgi:hypothetical protein